MKVYHVVLAVGSLAIAQGAGGAASLREIQYAKAPSWVLPPPNLPSGGQPGEAAFRIIYQDTEERITEGQLESYSAYRIKIFKPEALPLGNVAVAWSPSAGSATVHYVRIIRDLQTLDVLKQARFKVLERETGLEQSILDGNLTATLQIPGLRVGDEIEFAGTILRRESAFGGHAAGVAQLPANGLPGVYRYRLLWPERKALPWRMTKDLPAASPETVGGFKALTVEMTDPSLIPDVEGAPPRDNVRRAIEHSDYDGWPDLSRQAWPLFAKAAALRRDSPIRAEVAKIAAASGDPAERTQAALRLVQEQVRYVFVGLDGGNYLPASADETWQRRFGDCKAKTALLLALLDQLGVAAEPVLVNSRGGDGTSERMPSPTLFDHVLVRATVHGKTVWLDGTRLGDRFLDMLPPPEFAWALPLNAAGAELAAVPARPLAHPQSITIMDIDASGGFAKDAAWTMSHILRGGEALQIRSALSTVSPADADRLLKTYWREKANWVEPRQVSWRYDERYAAVVLGLIGAGKVDWEGDAVGGRRLTIPGAGFYPPAKMERPKDQDQAAAWAIEHPRFRCWATTIRLPPNSPKYSWSYSASSVNRRLGGTSYWRTAGMQGNVVRTVMSRQSYAREISASEARQVNAAIGTFDNNMSVVEEIRTAGSGKSSALPFPDGVNWAADGGACAAPVGRSGGRSS